jgi:3-hydroxyisobutyrate dehydrogenase-like beta-hydroxyacid dehydrogenase
MTEARADPTAAPHVGFVGLGRMGEALAGRLLAAGYSLHGTNRTPTRAQGLVDAGLRWHDTPREVAESVSVLFTSVSDEVALDAVASGPDGIVAGLGAGTVWLELSTVSPQASRALAAQVRSREATLLDAPVSGSVPQAQAGTLLIIAGGDEHSYERVMPILNELGTPTHVGPNGHGLVLKLAINLSIAAQMHAFAEGLVFAERSSVEPKLALEVMAASGIGSPMLRARAAIVLEPLEEAWFDISLMRKDISLVLDEARRLGVSLASAEQAADVLDRARARGYGERDIAALFEALRLGEFPDADFDVIAR